MPQLLLPLFSENLTLINNLVGFQKENEKIYYFLGQAVLFQHDKKDVKSFRFITSQLVINGNVKQSEIVKAFGVSKRSVTRYVKKYNEGGAEAIFIKKKGRSSHILTPEVVEQIRKKLVVTPSFRFAHSGFTTGKSKSEISVELGIKYDTLLKGIKRKNLEVKKKL